MMSMLTIEVIDITTQYKKGDISSPGLGATTITEMVIEVTLDAWLNQMAQEADKIYLLKWQGGRVPRGAEVSGWTIGWTQHGIVSDVEGTNIGTYERIKDYVGNPPLNEMVVFITKMAE